MKNYLILEKSIHDLSNISNAISILNWDSATYMPRSSGVSRAEVLATLSKIMHENFLNPKTEELIKLSYDEESSLDNWQKANLNLINKKFLHDSAIKSSLLEKFVQSTSKCELLWREAKSKDDFKIVKSALEDVVNITKEVAYQKSLKLNLSPYDALLDQYSPGIKSEQIEKDFETLKLTIPSIFKEAEKKSRSNSEILIPVISSVDQESICFDIAKSLGFNFSRGRIDKSAHPFCGGNAFDVRITNRYDENNFLSAVMGIVHETGHALYEMNLPDKYKNQLVGRAAGMAVHESQSLFMEMQVARSLEFAKYLSELIKNRLNLSVDYNDLYNLMTVVKLSPVRVDSDEVSYALHIIMRFELEKELISGELSVSDLPDAWSEKMNKYLMLNPLSNIDGCMQDIHWYIGAFGYFPSYVYGSMLSASLMNRMRNDNGYEFLKEIEKGRFDNIVKFLNSNIHSFASLKTYNDILLSFSGEENLVKDYINYLTKKYIFNK